MLYVINILIYIILSRICRENRRYSRRGRLPKSDAVLPSTQKLKHPLANSQLFYSQSKDGHYDCRRSSHIALFIGMREKPRRSGRRWI